MAVNYRLNAERLATKDTFNRVPFRSVTQQSLAQNSNHLHGTRARQLVADWDIWYEIPAAADATYPQYWVTVSEGVTYLSGMVIWASPDGPTGFESNITLGWESERADDGAGTAVANALDTVTTPTVSERWWDFATPTSGALVTFEGFNLFSPNMPWRFHASGFGVEHEDHVWAPNLGTSNEQRIRCVISSTEFGNQSNSWLVGVYVNEHVPTE